MDTLTFISVIVGHLAWPSLMAFVIVIFRRDIAKAMSSIKRLRHRETEINFHEEMYEAKKIARGSNSLPLDSEEDDYLAELATLSPRGAVIESWLKVEEALRKFAARHGIGENVGKPFTLREVVWHNLDYQALGKGTIEMLERLRRLRNEAVHMKDWDITENSAKEYQVLARRVINVIEQA